ncbi:MAG: ACP phosphodiesterase [Ferruginibacter sp.]
MNFLGHACLSFHHKEILLGNMISDFVKGKKQYDFPIPIQKGIQLHRAIDTFTDDHPDVKAMAEHFRSDYRLYAGAIVDVVMDYFIANDKNQFPSSSVLEEFSKEVYTSLDEFKAYFPLRFAGMFPYMQSQDWLYNYRFERGIKNSMEGLKRRARYINEMETAFDIFNANKDFLQDRFNEFYPSVKIFAVRKMHDLLNS